MAAVTFPPMDELIERLRQRPGIAVKDVGSAWEVRFAHPQGYLFEFTIPRGVLERFVSMLERADGFRVIKKGRYFSCKVAEWFIEGEWQDVWGIE